jgi:hypothetical protein
MRTYHISAGSLLVFAASALSGEPVSVAPTPPMLMTASATACGPAISLHIRPAQFKPVVIDVNRQIPVSDSAVVNGRVVERVRNMTVTQQETIFQQILGPTIDVFLDGAEVQVLDLKGKPVPPARVAQLLKKEIAVLVSHNGPVDPFYLQTTKPGTLIIQMPMNRFVQPTEVLPPAKRDPSEPPLANPPK